MFSNAVLNRRRFSSSPRNIPSQVIFLPTWTQIFKSIPAMGAALTILFVIAILATSQFGLSLSRNSPLAPLSRDHSARKVREENASKHSWCLLYDKAPRTGSTTIARSLAKCWKSISNFHVTMREGRFSTAIPTLLKTPYRKIVALVGSHFSISGNDILSLKSKCENILYVTSTRRMSERLWSEAKYIVTNADIRHNSSLTAANIPHAWTTLFNRLSKSEPYFENYPFVSSYDNVENIASNQNENWLDPGYIIRTDYMKDDLSMLLRAFGCGDNNIQVTNMHTVDLQHELNPNFEKSEGDPQNNPSNLSNISLRMGDFRHNYLSQLAKSVNSNGIAMAKEVMHIS